MEAIICLCYIYRTSFHRLGLLLFITINSLSTFALSNCEHNQFNCAYIFLHDNHATLVATNIALLDQDTTRFVPYPNDRITKQSMMTSQHSLVATLATKTFRNRQVELQSNLPTNHSYIPMASFSAYWNLVDLYISTSGASKSITKSLFTIRDAVTIFDYHGSMAGIAGTETRVSIMIPWPIYCENPPPCSAESDGRGRCTIIAESVQLIY